MPLLLLGVRDELVGRPWRPPARHWPGSPLVGGIDEQAGGTWLAVHPDIPRVACLLNGRGTEADPARRRSRGELPLRAAADGAGVLKELADDPARSPPTTRSTWSAPSRTRPRCWPGTASGPRPATSPRARTC